MQNFLGHLRTVGMVVSFASNVMKYGESARPAHQAKLIIGLLRNAIVMCYLLLDRTSQNCRSIYIKVYSKLLPL